MVEEDVNQQTIDKFMSKFDELDEEDDGVMGINEFLVLYREIMGQPDLTRADAEVIFRGIDIDGNGYVSRDEFHDMVVSAVKKDFLSQYKMLFRSFDTDRSRTLSANEIVELCNYIGKEFTREQAEFAIQRSGSRTLTFAQLYKLLTRQEIDPSTDPYDGKLKKSSCCSIF